QVEHGHEVALAGAEAAVQVAGLAAAALDRALDESQRLVKAPPKLRRHDVVAHRPLGIPHALGQLEDEVALVHPLGDADQLLEQHLLAHSAASLRSRPRLRLLVLAGGVQPASASSLTPNDRACSRTNSAK